MKRGQVIPGVEFNGKKTVAVIGYGPGDWAAYAGPSSWSHDEVARRGDKLDERVAKALFPKVARKMSYYRW